MSTCQTPREDTLTARVPSSRQCSQQRARLPVPVRPRWPRRAIWQAQALDLVVLIHEPHQDESRASARSTAARGVLAASAAESELLVTGSHAIIAGRLARPTAAELARLAPEAPPELIEGHLRRLSASYFRTFALPAIARHVQGLSQLSRLHPAEVQVQALPDDQLSCTFLAFDAPSLLSLLTGVLASLGFNVSSGDAYTYRPVEASGAGDGRSWLHRHREDTLWRQRIVDRVTGQVAGDQPLDAWSSELARRVETVAGMVQRGELDAARRLVNEWVVGRLAADGAASPASPFETEVRIRAARTGKLMLDVLSVDTPAFLYSLSAALALENTTIEAVRIRTRGRRVHDRLTLELAPAADIEAAEQRLRLSALLTKQFTYFLGSAADPYAALARFDWLTRHMLAGGDQARWLEVLSDPGGMTLLARLLGASDFLWDDFIRPRAEDVLPALRRHLSGGGSAAAEPTVTPPASGGAAGARVGGEAASLEQRLADINQRKDAASFVAELDYILGGGADVENLSRGLTHIAEDAIGGLAGALYADLSAEEEARPGQGALPPHAIFGLGKFGAQALGYASDLELLLVYDGQSKAASSAAARHAAFFGTLVQRLEQSITAKQRGLFQLDLRLRPYGRNAALECSWQTFRDYYGPAGEAHSLERLALTRLRAVAGDAAFGRRVEQLRDELIYEQVWLRMDELGEVRRQQFQEKAAGTRNAKYSAGALVDCEYLVQVLQVCHGAGHEFVRSPEIGGAVHALTAADVLRSGEAEGLLAAYLFFRRLINSLRMLRGLADDLVLPDSASAEALHLARRMGWSSSATTPPAEGLEAEFERHRGHVRACVERYAPELSVSS